MNAQRHQLLGCIGAALAAKILLLGHLFALAQAPGTLLWSIPIVSSSPAIGTDGTLYVSGFLVSANGYSNGVFGVSPNGTVQWYCPVGQATMPAVDASGTIYVGSDDGKLYAIHPDGSVKWTFQTEYDVSSPPAFGADNTIYVNSHDGNCYALNPDGTRKWQYTVGTQLGWSPAIGEDGTVYLTHSQLVALTPDGSLRWTFSPSLVANAPPALGPGGNIYFGSWAPAGFGAVYAINPDGTQLWHYGFGLQSSVVFGGDGTIYTVALWPTSLTAIASTNRTALWSRGGGENPRGYLGTPSTPAVADNGVIYYGSYDWNRQAAVYAISPDGTTNWMLSIAATKIQSPAIGLHGTVYVGTDAGFFAVRGDAPLARTAWPKLGQNERNTGRVQWPRLRALACTSEKVQVEVFADPGWDCTVQASSNLLDWSTVTNFVAVTNRNFVSDAITPEIDQRFYRVISPSL